MSEQIIARAIPRKLLTHIQLSLVDRVEMLKKAMQRLREQPTSSHNARLMTRLGKDLFLTEESLKAICK